jgi:hypothetical protein
MIVDVAAEDGELLERFYRELYLPAFAAQREPLETWQAALAGELPYRMFARLAVDHDVLLGGITYELYPSSECGLITYVVVDAAARRAGLGRRLVFDATGELLRIGAHAVFGEMNDPRVRGDWDRIARFQRWGCRVVDTRYVQPALGPGLERDRGLVLIVHPPVRDALAGTLVRAFITELHAVTEHSEPDAELRAILDGIPERVELVELAR